MDSPHQSAAATPDDGGSGLVRPRAPALAATLLDVDAPEWTGLLGAVRHDFYHLPAYLRLCAAQDQARACALYVTEGDRSLLLPLLIRDIPGGRRDAISPYGYPGPVGIGTDDPAFLHRALAAGLRVLGDDGLVSVFVRLHPLLDRVMPEGLGTLVVHGDTVSIDLTRASEELWAQTRLNHRRDITRATRLGYTTRMDDEWRHLERFRHLYRATMERRSARSFYFFDDAYFDGLRDALAERVHLAVVERDGDMAGGALFIETDGIVQYHLSGADEEALDVRPMKQLIHFATGWAKGRGDRVLHLGGGLGAADDSLLRFKAGFSPLRHRFATMRVVLDETAYRELVAARDPSLDPDDRTGFFPLYRAD